MAFDTLVDYSRRTFDAIVSRAQRLGSGALVAGSVAAGQIYDQRTFRHFLRLERKRAARTNRPVLLLMVGAAAEAGRMDQALGTRVFAAMSACVREVDFIGWYRENQVAAAVLTQGPGPIPAQTRQLITERVMDALRRELPARDANALQVRVLQVRRRR